MGMRRVGSHWGLVLLGILATGCGSDAKDTCESLCHWVDQCGDDDSITCSKADIDSCVDDYHDFDGDCQDAMDDFADCLDKNGKCEDVEAHCIDQANVVIKKCDELF